MTIPTAIGSNKVEKTKDTNNSDIEKQSFDEPIDEIELQFNHRRTFLNRIAITQVIFGGLLFFSAYRNILPKDLSFNTSDNVRFTSLSLASLAIVSGVISLMATTTKIPKVGSWKMGWRYVLTIIVSILSSAAFTFIGLSSTTHLIFRNTRDGDDCDNISSFYTGCLVGVGVGLILNALAVDTCIKILRRAQPLSRESSTQTQII